MKLTKREKMILQLRVDGLKQNDIAKKLKISQPAVSSFENNAYRKIRSAQEILVFVEENKVEVDFDE